MDQTIDIYDQVNFDYGRYYNAIKNDDAEYKDKNPIEIYEEKVLEYLRINHPGKTLEDVADTGTIIEEKNLVLPASLPYETAGEVRRYDSVDEHDTCPTEPKDWARYVTLDVAKQQADGTPDPNVVMFSDKKFKLAELTTRRLTLTFEACGANCVLSKFRLDGEPRGATLIATGELNWWDPFVIDITLDGAPGTQQGEEDHNIVVRYMNNMVGGYYLIGTGGDVSNWSQVHRAADELLAANKTYSIINDENGVPYVDADKDGVIDPEEVPLLEDADAMDALAGGLMYTAMNLYFAQFRDEIAGLDALNHVISPINGFAGMVSSVYDIEYLDETAFSVMPGGLLIDMKGQEFSGTWRTNAAEVSAGKHFELIGHVMSSLEHEIWQELTGYDAVSTVRGIQMAIANNGADLLNPKKNDTEDTLPGLYPSFGFANQAPSPFQLELLGSGDDLFSTRPATWSHPTGGEEYFVLFKEIVDLSTSDLRLNGWTVQAHGSASGPYAWTDCVNGWENDLIYYIGIYGENGYFTSHSYFCDGTDFYNWTLGNALDYVESFFNNNLKPVIFGADFFDYCDENLPGDPFVSIDYAYRPYPCSVDQYSTSLIIDIRDNLYTISSNHWQEYLIPSNKPTGDLYRFVVYIKKTHEQGTDKLTGLSFKIMNDYGGGYVEESGGTLIPAEELEEFNNEVFTDKNLIMQANNNQVITPSTVDPVSTVTGNMYHDETDVIIKGRGLDMVFTRTYNSGLTERDDTDFPMSKGWTHSYDMKLVSNDYTEKPNEDITENSNGVVSSITYMDERGGEVIYPVDGDGGSWLVTQPRGGFNTLEMDTPSTGEHTVTFRNGVKYVFEGIGGVNMRTVGDTARLKRIEDPYGNELTLTYDGNGRLSDIDDNLNITGRTGLTFAYHPDGRLAEVSDWAGRTWTFGYANENLTSVTNPKGETVQYTYKTGSHLLEDIILPQDRGGQNVTTSFDYYENNRAFSYENKLGNSETMDYDLYRKRTRVSGPRGFVRQYTYDENGALVKLENPDKGILLFDNNADGLRFSKTDALGYDTAYSYNTARTLDGAASDTGGNVTLEQDEYANTVEYDYGLFDQITRVKDKNGNERFYTCYQTTVPGSGAVRGKLQKAEAMLGIQRVTLEEYTWYDDCNLKQKIEYIDKDDPSKKRVTDYTYQDNGLNLQQMTVTGQPGGDSWTVTYTYDNLGRKETETLTRRTSPTDPTPIQLTITYEYDGLDRVIKVTDPLGNIAGTVYDANDKVFQEKVHHKIPGGGYDIRTYVTREYNAADRLIKETDIYGKEIHYEYDEAGNLIKVTDANGHITRSEYNAKGRRTAVIDANGHRTETVYDLAGNVIKTIDGNGKAIQFEYDALGRKTKDITPMGFETQYVYNANGNLTKVIDANAVAGLQPKNSYGATVYNQYDNFDRISKTVDAINGETVYTYDLLSNMTSITDAEGHVTEFVYDNLGRLIEVIDPIHETPTDKTVRYTLYDETGNLLIKIDRQDRITHYTYDELNRLRHVDYLSDAESETYTYDMYGDLTEIANSSVTYTYAYDLKHRMTSKTDSRLNRTLAWQYDDVGNVIRKTDYQGEITEYVYAGTNRLVSLRNRSYLQVSYHYDPAGRLLDRILSNRAKTNYKYDDDNRLTQLTNRSAGDKLNQTQTYTYDNIGNITGLTDASGPAIFVYDPLYRLTNADYPGTADDVSYTYDDVGNRLTETKLGVIYTYVYNNDGNRLDEVKQGSTTIFKYYYDDNGNRIGKRNGSDTVLQSYQYDQKNLISALTTLTDTHHFDYDPNDYRISKLDSEGTRVYLLEGEHLEAVYDSSDQIQAKYLRGVVVDEIVNGYYYDVYGKKTNYTFHHDQLRSVVALTAHEGSTVETTKYGPFGEVIDAAGTSENFLKYTGREHDEELGLYYYRARYYDSEVGRFLNEDPLGFEAGVNFYTYVSNNPVNANDPTGLTVVSNIGFLWDWATGGGSSNRVYGAETVQTQEMMVSPGGNALRDAFYTGGGQNIAAGRGGFAYDTYQAGLNTVLNPITADWSSTATQVGGFAGASAINNGNGTVTFTIPNVAGTNSFFYHAVPDRSGDTGPMRNINQTFIWTEEMSSPGGASGLWSSGASGSWDSSAAGGFVLYPNKPNTNMMRSVYAK